LEVVQEYRDCGVSGKKARRPGLDALVADARRKKFSVVLVSAFDRIARSVKHFLHVMDEFDSLGVVFISRRENIDTSGPMGRLFLTLIGSISELESALIKDRVLAGMRRAKLDGVRTLRMLDSPVNSFLRRISPPVLLNSLLRGSPSLMPHGATTKRRQGSGCEPRKPRTRCKSDISFAPRKAGSAKLS
jgi:hypothetical protein